jgi:hypothetical protein
MIYKPADRLFILVNQPINSINFFFPQSTSQPNQPINVFSFDLSPLAFNLLSLNHPIQPVNFSTRSEIPANAKSQIRPHGTAVIAE